jgi:hypothetical protein
LQSLKLLKKNPVFVQLNNHFLISQGRLFLNKTLSHIDGNLGYFSVICECCEVWLFNTLINSCFEPRMALVLFSRC